MYTRVSSELLNLPNIREDYQSNRYKRKAVTVILTYYSARVIKMVIVN